MRTIGSYKLADYGSIVPIEDNNLIQPINKNGLEYKLDEQKNQRSNPFKPCSNP